MKPWERADYVEPFTREELIAKRDEFARMAAGERAAGRPGVAQEWESGHREVVERLTALESRSAFLALYDRLTAATGSPGMVSLHEGKVHMTLDEWERLVRYAERLAALIAPEGGRLWGH